MLFSTVVRMHNVGHSVRIGRNGVFCLAVTWRFHFTLVRGWQGLIAYGCHSLVVVIDSTTAQTLQVLEKHKADVVKVSQVPLRNCLKFPIYPGPR